MTDLHFRDLEAMKRATHIFLYAAEIFTFVVLVAAQVLIKTDISQAGGILAGLCLVIGLLVIVAFNEVIQSKVGNDLLFPKFNL